MIVDASNIENDKILSTDLCIVGAGVAGITIAREFINSDISAIMLESGDLMPDPDLQSLNLGKNIGLPYFDLESARARAFGGTSHRWHVEINNHQKGVRLCTLDKIDFEKRDWVPYSGWPFQKKALDPYYDKAHQVFQIGPNNYDVENWEVRDEGSQLQFSDKKVKTTIYQFARRDIFYNDCRQEIEAADNITTYLNATVLNIKTTDNAKLAEYVLVETKGRKNFFVKARYIILSLGGLETPRLLLLSRDVIKKGLGNQNDLVGRFFMEHPHHSRSSGSGRYIPSDSEAFNKSNLLYNIHIRHGVPILGYLSLSEEVIRENKLLNFAVYISGNSELKTSGFENAKESLKTIAAVLRGKKQESLIKQTRTVYSNINELIYEAMRRLLGGERNNWNRYEQHYSGVYLRMMAEQIPDPESRILLDKEPDKFGQNKIKLNWKLNSMDIRSMRKSLEIIDCALRSANLGCLEINMKNDAPPKRIKGGYHHMGTTRMHTDPNFGVVDSNCKVHGIKNLFIASSSVFPTSGYANPTLTIVALSLRLADHLKKFISE